MQTLIMGAEALAAGSIDLVVAGGMESMSNGPHYLPRSREGAKYGDWVLKDSVAVDALTCAFDQVAMGESTEAFNGKYSFPRGHRMSSALPRTRARTRRTRLAAFRPRLCRLRLIWVEAKIVWLEAFWLKCSISPENQLPT